MSAMRAVMNFYEGAKARVKVGLELSEEFEVKVGAPGICVVTVGFCDRS